MKKCKDTNSANRDKNQNNGTPVEEIITYSRPSDEYGMLGNMAGGMPIVINGHKVYASEHLYLCGYWSLNTDLHKQIQEYCLSQKSGTYAKRCTKKKYIQDARTDFHDFKHDWMIWVVWQKALQNENFCTHLLSTGGAHIYEVVPKDPVWAAYPDANGVMQGANGMGEILMMIRDCLRKNVEPTYNKDLLNKSGIYFLGEKLTFLVEQSFSVFFNTW